MILIEMNDLKRISFPDFNILNVHFDPEQKVLEIKIEGAWLESNLGGTTLKNGLLKFCSWSRFKIRKFSQNGQWINLNLNEFEPLKEICEFEVWENSLRLQGFSKTSGLWLEYELFSAEVCFIFDK